MNSKDLETAALQENKLSTDEEEIDKKFVSQAVAFVIGHTRNGFVALCAGVATLLKEQAKLKLENESLKEQVSQQQHQLQCVNLNFERNYSLSENKEYKLSLVDESLNPELSKFNHKDLHQRGYQALKGCICYTCTNIIKNAEMLSVPLRRGERVIINGEICGTVCYAGHVESLSFPEIFIGLYLDEAVGDTNGHVGEKRYFSVPQGYGLFTPLWTVCCILE